MAINVNRQVLDPFYRYKMPRLQAKVEGKGNGIKTVIANMSEIAKALDRPPTYATKFFGCELGAQTNFDPKNERYIVNGEHDANKLQDILDGFIRKFVLCPHCDNPETVLQVRKGQIHQSCKACGHKLVMNNKHRLLTFILKHPPAKVDDLVKKDGGGTPTDECDNGFDLTQNGGNRNASSDENADDEEDWDPEGLDAEQPDNRKPVLSSKMAKLTMDKDLDKSQEERLDMLHEYLLAAKTSGKLLDDTKAILNESERLELKSKTTLLLCDVIFDESVLEQIATYRTLLLRFTLDDHRAQRHLLGGIEQLISKHKASLLAKSAHIVKAFYDCDILEEKLILSWKASSKYVKKDASKEIIGKAEPFLKWLREAESESDQEEDEKIEFDDRAREAKTIVEKIPTGMVDSGAKVTNGRTEADDLDIDNI